VSIVTAGASRRRGRAAAVTAGAITFLLTGCGPADIVTTKGARNAVSVRRYLPATAIGSAAVGMKLGPMVRFDSDVDMTMRSEREGAARITVQARGAMEPINDLLTVNSKVRSTFGSKTSSERSRTTVAGERVYIQIPGETVWVRLNAEQARALDVDPTGSDPTQTPELLDSVKDEARRVGREKVNGVETTRYEGTIEEDGDGITDAGIAEAAGERPQWWEQLGLTKLDFTVHLTDDHFPIRVVAKGSGSTTIEGRDLDTSISVTTNYTGWGEFVKIKAPKDWISAKEAGLTEYLSRPDDLPAV
jgi:hypothetical protein